MQGIDTQNPFTALGITPSGQDNNLNKIGADDFLQLMITQLQNQDPNNPLDSQQFLGQLAQFSSVTGLQELQQSFDALAVSLTSNQALQAAALVDKEVLVPSEIGYLGDSGDLSGQIVPFGAVDNLSVVVADASGAVVRELQGSVGTDGVAQFRWDGLSAAGDRMPAGQYEIRVRASTGGRSVDSQVIINARVDSVGLGGAGQPLMLQLEGLGSIPLNEIRGIG